MKIGLFSSASSPISSPNRFERSVDFLRKKGHEIIFGDLTSKCSKYFYCAGTPEQRVQEFNKLLCTDVNYLYATIGGLNSASVLSGIDYELIKKTGKIIIGNSDITSLTTAIYTKTGIPTVYFMTCLPAFGEIGQFAEVNYKYLNEIVFNKPKSYAYSPYEAWTDDYINWENYEQDKILKPNKWLSLNGGYAEGVLVGGNFETLCKLNGTEFQFDFRDKIVFLEDTFSSAQLIETNFYSFYNNHHFDQVKGLILSKCEQYDDKGTGLTFSEWFYNFTSSNGINIPILGEFDCGHTHPCMPLIIGGTYRLSINHNQIELVFLNK